MAELPQNPMRAVLEIDFDKQVQLTGILSSIEEFRPLIDPDVYVSASGTLAEMTRLLEESHDTQMSVTDGDLMALGVVVDAAWTFTNRKSSPFPITPLNQIAGLDDTDFCNLSGWLEESRQKLFPSAYAPLGDVLKECHGEAGARAETESPLHSGSGSVNLAPVLVEIDEPKHRHLLEILTYVKGIHYEIDPEMYRIGVEHFDALKKLLKRSALQPKVILSSDELSLVETLVSAAWTYSYRSRGNGLSGVKDPDFERLIKWTGKVHQAMLRSAGLPVIDLKG
jgi:hypothetical protein